MERAKKIKGVLDLIKIENSLFVLPFVYIGMILAGNVTLVKIILITIALITARGAAFSINRYVGWKYDKSNPKKKNWSSVSLYSRSDLLIIFIIFAIIFEASAYSLNLLAAALAPFVLLIVIFEPYAKKYTAHRHLLMGFVIGLGILGGYVGGSGIFPTSLPLYVLLLGYMCFSGGSDVIYTLSHVDFDKKNGLRTYPVKYGIKLAKQISECLHYWAGALFVEFGAMLGSPVIVIAGLISIPIFYTEHRNLSEKSEKSIATTFFYYNAFVSIMMLVAVIIAVYK